MELSQKKNIVHDHISSDRHSRGKETRKTELLRQETIIKNWDLYQKRHAAYLSSTGLAPAVGSAQNLSQIEVAWSWNPAS